MGGRFSFLASTVYADRLKAAVSFYGGGIADPNDTLGRKSLLDLIPQLQAPILLIYGAKDASIKSSEPEKIAKALYDANKNYTIKVIANAGHGFASYDRDSYVEEAAQQAWKTTLAFFGEHLNGLKN
jgi:carboxymethylenebutenolidase